MNHYILIISKFKPGDFVTWNMLHPYVHHVLPSGVEGGLAHVGKTKNLSGSWSKQLLPRSLPNERADSGVEPHRGTSAFLRLKMVK